VFVVGEFKDTEGDVERSLLIGTVLVAEEGPATIKSAKEERAGMAGVAKREPATGCEKGGNDRCGEAAVARERGELLVEEANEFLLVEPIDKAAHERAQIGGHGSDGLAVARNIGEEQAANATGGTTRDVVDIAAALGLAKWLAIDPDIETGQFDPTGRKLAASPDLHTLHVLLRGIHGSIITGETRRVRLEPFGRSEQILVSRLWRRSRLPRL